MIRYRTEYPNQVHLLQVTVSKHFYLTKKGILAFQKKPFEVDLENLPESNKIHVINYLVKDHCSSVLYGEISTSSNVLSPVEFLFRAWSQKTSYPFCGIPKGITIPKTVQTQFPNLTGKIESLGVKIIQVTSGFQSGIGDIKNWEKWLYYCKDKPFSEAEQFTIVMCNSISKMETRGEIKIKRWTEHVKDIRFPPEDWIL